MASAQVLELGLLSGVAGVALHRIAMNCVAGVVAPRLGQRS